MTRQPTQQTISIANSVADARGVADPRQGIAAKRDRRGYDKNGFLTSVLVSVMAFYLEDKFINPLTDFGFKRIFGSEPNQSLLIDFLNTLLPPHHRIQSLTYKSTENLGNTPIDRKAIFDIYCQGENGDRFIVEIQKAKQNFFKDRSVYYASFPIQEQALQGTWDYRLAPVYTVGVLDFVFDDHKHQSTLIHTVELKDQNCQVFYDKLKFIYIELPKFTKTLAQLQTHLDKWLFLLKHLPDLTDRPEPLQEEIFNQLFDVAEIANFSRMEQDSYQNSLKYYRDLNNVVDTARQEGIEEERELNRQRQSALVMRLLVRQLGGLPDAVQQQVNQLSQDRLDRLTEAVFELANQGDLMDWLNQLDEG